MVPRLIGGPYVAPVVRRGDVLPDEAAGADAIVGGMTSAPIPWPRRRKSGRASLIVCGDLVRAVQTESVAAVCHWWGVGEVTVWHWRRALGVDRMTDGTVAVFREIMPAKLDEAAAARGRERASAPDIVAEIAAAKRGREAAPATRAALLEAAKRPKKPGWGARASAWMRAGKARDH